MPRSEQGAAPELIESPSHLQSVVDEAHAGATFGMDTEFMREKTYRVRLCLVQISTRDGIYLLDPLDGPDLEPVADLIADGSTEVVVHAGRQDFEIFHERFGAEPAKVFDVQVVAGFAGYGASLPYGRLVESVTGTQLTKGESYTDWCRRPLTDAQLRYAADDVRYLLVIADVLKDKLRVSGRLGWAEDEMAHLQDASLYSTDQNEIWRKVSGRGSLSGKQMAVLRELASWREEMAVKRDLPRGWVIKDQTLIEIARRAPKSIPELRNVRGLAPKEAERSGDALLEAIVRGRESGPIETPKGASRTAQVRARMMAGLADALVRSRAEHAGIASEIVSTRPELEAFLGDVFDGRLDPGRQRLLRGWRKDLVGDALVDLAEGRIAIRSTDKPPYVEEVGLG